MYLIISQLKNLLILCYLLLEIDKLLELIAESSFLNVCFLYTYNTTGQYPSCVHYWLHYSLVYTRNIPCFSQIYRPYLV